MSPAKTCAQCAAPLPDDAPEGAICAACEAEAQGTLATPSGFQPPTPSRTPSYTLPPAQPQFTAIGDYEVIDKLGQGGMGAVYRARQLSLGRVVALKVLPQQFEEDEDYVARFQREAAVAARLNHPNLVRVYAAGQADGCHFIAMELVEGENLRQRMKRGPVSMSEALRICADVARALQCGWDQAQLIHRDIKPANIYLSAAGEVKLGDLGLAKSALANTTGITQTGTSLGTPLYMSPEQGRGDRQIDFRSDIYSLGCTLYELLTGKPPYEGRDGHTLIHQHIHAPLPAILKVLPGCPMPLVRLVGRMLKKNARERHASYQDLIAELDFVREQLDAGPVTTAPSAVVEAWKKVGDIEAAPAASYGLIWTGLLVVIIVAGGIAWWALRPKPKADPSRTAAAATRAPEPRAPSPAAATSTSTIPAATGDFRSLFDGRTFAGWKKLGGDDWTIADGALIAGRSNLMSDEQFGDFELTLEWRVSADGNGGVSYHAPLTGNSSVPEMQLCGPKGDPEWATGTLYHVVRTTEDATPTPGQWNRARLVVRGAKAEHWINDRLVCSYDFDDPSWLAVAANAGYPVATRYAALPRRGALILHGNRPEIAYRNIRIRPLDRQPATEAPKPTASTPGTSSSTSPQWQRIDFATATPDSLGKNGTKEGDTLHLRNNETHGGGIKARDGAVRATIVADSSMRNVRVVTRMDKGQYFASVWGDHIDLVYQAPGNSKTLKSFRHPTLPPKAGEEFTLQFASIGDTHTVWLNGQRLGSVEDSTSSQPGSLSIQALDGRFKSMEWINLDGLPEADALKLAGAAPSSPAASGDWHDLLAGVDLTRAAVAGTWKKVADGIELEKPSGPGVLEFNDPAPSDYEYEIEFTPTTSGNNVNQHLSMEGHTFIWKMNAHAKSPPLYGLGMVDGKHCSDAGGVGSTHDLELRPGTRYTSRVVIHPGRVQAFMNGTEYLTWAGDPQRLSTSGGDAPLRDPRHLGLGSWGRGVIFHRAAVRPLGGESKAASAPAADALTFAGHRYQLVRENLGWTEAKAKAIAMGGHLVVIESAEENDWIRRTFVDPLPEGKMFWIGATNSGPDGKWRWVTGAEITFAGWAPDILEQKRLTEPNSSSGFCRNMKQGIGWSLWGHTATGVARNIGFLVEWDDLGSAAVSPSPSLPPSSSVATATKDAPFVNSLGMKFVPVPITGGPTSGKRVLFSVWETRNQDFIEFAREKALAWRPPGGPDMESVARNLPLLPAVNMSWEEATAFCAWLTERERKAGRLSAGEVYRLPSDHEWSCAVGIGDREDPSLSPSEKNKRLPGIYPWGTTWPPPPRSGNFADEQMHRGDPVDANRDYLRGYDDGYAKNSPVGTFPPNPLGLYDIAGNAQEWCDDYFDGEKKRRTERGSGIFTGGEPGFLSSHRNPVDGDHRTYGVGFRPVLAPAP